jgi:N utilization substance protein A
MKGSRVQSIIRELRGEKIDIIEFSEDLVTLAQSALAPARITRVSITHHGEEPHLDVIVEDEQLSLAIGKRGQNVRLASELLGAKIDIKSESDVKDEVTDALARMLQSSVAGAAKGLDLTEAPGVGPKTAEALAAAGFAELDKLTAASLEELTAVEGVGDKTAQELVAWAQERSAARAEEGGGSATMDDQDFMAALSRAFQESENALGPVGGVPEGEDAAADTPEDADATPAADPDEEPTTPLLPLRRDERPADD